MNIMVFDVAAESGGALTVLLNYYSEFKLDKKNEYYFILSTPKLKEVNNIRVIQFPWTKKSWLHRLIFDHLIAPKLVKKYKIDKIISLQNILVPHTKIYQSVLVHNAIPFSEYRFSFTKDYKAWIYKNLIGILIKNSIKKADHITVQTNWMKNKCIEQLNIKSSKIDVKFPKVNIEVKKTYKKVVDTPTSFLYPAGGSLYKNHKLIIDACLRLKENCYTDYEIIFTLQGNENSHIKNIFNIVVNNQLPIRFVGTLKQEDLFDLYSKTVLLFPSYIETVGLPLLEAKFHQAPILASDCPFSHEILNEYDKVEFFNPFNSNDLFNLLKNCLKT